MKNVISMFLTIFISFSFGFQDWTKIVKRAKPAVVSIFIYNEYDDPMGYGSGFILNENGDIVTCRHVLDGAYSAQVKYDNGEYHSIRNVIAEDLENDVIIVSMYGDYRGPFLKIADSLPKVGEWVIVIGNPHELEHTVTEGIISAIRGEFGSEEIQLSAPGAPGQSGAPILNLQGEVLGIITSYIGDVWENFQFATPGVTIVKLHLDEGTNLYDWQVNRKHKGNFMQCISKSFYRCRFALVCINEALKEYLELSKVFDSRRAVWARTYFKLGQFHQFIGQSQNARKMYNRTIENNENYLEAYRNLGVLYLNDKEYYDAWYILKKALRIKPDDYDIHYKMGIASFKDEIYSDAIDCFEQSIFYYPSYAKAHLKLGESYLKVGDKVSALVEYEYLMDLDKDLAKELFDMIYEDKIPLGEKQYKNFFKEKEW